MPSVTELFRTWRRAFKSKLPYVRRREYRILQKKYADLIEALDLQASPAAQAELLIVKPPEGNLAGEICLFVSFADRPDLKPHVARHIGYLLNAGIRVVLVLNTDLPMTSLVIEEALRNRLSGLFVRKNLGFDFAAWAHAMSLCGDVTRWSRLYLANDSIVGPLNDQDFERMLVRIRGSCADVVGLTENLSPRRHLQSYFLVFGATALRHQCVSDFFSRTRNWQNKGQVIDIYETRLTALMESAGLQCEALFPALTRDPKTSDDVILRWQELLRLGFPYVKASITINRGRANLTHPETNIHRS